MSKRGGGSKFEGEKDESSSSSSEEDEVSSDSDSDTNDAKDTQSTPGFIIKKDSETTIESESDSEPEPKKFAKAKDSLPSIRARLGRKARSKKNPKSSRSRSANAKSSSSSTKASNSKAKQSKIAKKSSACPIKTRVLQDKHRPKMNREIQHIYELNERRKRLKFAPKIYVCGFYKRRTIAAFGADISDHLKLTFRNNALPANTPIGERRPVEGLVKPPAVFAQCLDLDGVYDAFQAVKVAAEAKRNTEK